MTTPKGAARGLPEGFADLMYHYGACEHATPSHEEMFQGGDLLHHCQALRESDTGMGEPLRHPEWVRTYIEQRLVEWREPTSTWDTHVRALCLYALRHYHNPKCIETVSYTAMGEPSFSDCGNPLPCPTHPEASRASAPKGAP